MLFSEIYHARKWHSDFQAPMIMTSSELLVFQNDFIIFQHNILGPTHGKVLKFYGKVSL